MKYCRRAVIGLSSAILLPGCTAAPSSDSEEGDVEMPVKFSNLDTEPHWLAVKVRGDEQSSFVQEFAAYLEAEDSEEMYEPLRTDELLGDDFELEIRLDDDVRTDVFPRHAASRLSIRILEDESITYGTDAP